MIVDQVRPRNPMRSRGISPPHSSAIARARGTSRSSSNASVTRVPALADRVGLELALESASRRPAASSGRDA